MHLSKSNRQKEAGRVAGPWRTSLVPGKFGVPEDTGWGSGGEHFKNLGWWLTIIWSYQLATSFCLPAMHLHDLYAHLLETGEPLLTCPHALPNPDISLSFASKKLSIDH